MWWEGGRENLSMWWEGGREDLSRFLRAIIEMALSCSFDASTNAL